MKKSFKAVQRGDLPLDGTGLRTHNDLKTPTKIPTTNAKRNKSLDGNAHKDVGHIAATAGLEGYERFIQED